MVADKSRLDEYADLADRAVADVKKVLPRWRGKLVVEVPDSQADLDRMLDAKGNAYDAIAAVTTTVDGSLSSSSPVHIMVNPSVFDGLGDRGAQIVMSHEATHVATDAATSSMPMWLLEGFADYVALAHVDLPVSVTASQILADVRKDGPPKALPGPHEFDPANKALGASYEAAWLASSPPGRDLWRAPARSTSTAPWRVGRQQMSPLRASSAPASGPSQGSGGSTCSSWLREAWQG